MEQKHGLLLRQTKLTTAEMMLWRTLRKKINMDRVPNEPGRNNNDMGIREEWRMDADRIPQRVWKWNPW